MKRTLLIALALAFSGAAAAQSWPVKPVRVIIPSAVGGAYDTVLRAMQGAIQEELGQPLVIENNAGAGGIVGLQIGVRAAPDGYQLTQAGVSQLVLNPLFSETPYNTLKDFTPIGMIGDLTMALYVHNTVPVKDLKGLLEYAKANPGKINYGSSGVGMSFHLAGEMLSQKSGASLTHIPYKGTAQALQDLYAGRLQMMFYPPNGAVLGQIKQGVIRPVAAMSEKRLSQLPETPTFEEAGLGNLGVTGWGGMVGPAGLPRDIALKMNGALNKASARPEMAKAYETMTMVPNRISPDEMGQRMKNEIEFWSAMVKKLGLKQQAQQTNR
jgi:tripartite-type tricarboxylate transporter receptor subunit TctC